MIKIKVISFRQAINTMTSFAIYSFVSLFILALLFASAIFLEVSIKNNLLDEKVETFSKNSLLNYILKNETSIIKIEEPIKFEKKDAIKSSEPATDEKIIVKVKEKINREYSTVSKYDTTIYESGKIQVGNMLITNYSKKNLDLEELAKPIEINIKEDSKILIYHTHATESYTVKENTDIQNYRTTDVNYNMISIGNELKSALECANIKCVHDRTLHDYPSYNGSYALSLATVKKYLSTEKYDFLIDVHRDALSSNVSFRPTVEVDNQTAAKLMFVIGTDACGLKHDDWMTNLKYAIAIQNRGNEMYPRFI